VRVSLDSWTNDDRLAKVAPALAVNATAGAA
jgi:hypothetical protein